MIIKYQLINFSKLNFNTNFKVAKKDFIHICKMTSTFIRSTALLLKNIKVIRRGIFLVEYDKFVMIGLKISKKKRNLIDLLIVIDKR